MWTPPAPDQAGTPLPVPGIGDARAPRTPGIDSGYDPGSAHRPGSNVRPWWGLGETLLSVPFIVSAIIIGTVLGVAVAVLNGTDLVSLGDGSDPDGLPHELIVIPTLVQQIAMFSWPFLVSHWKGLGPERDWGWAFKPVDLAIGVGVAFMAIFAAGVVQTVMTALLDIEDEASATNTRVVSQFEGSPWLIGLLFIVVIGAPLSEEIYFRGMVQRSVQKRWGPVLGIMASALVFAPVHIADGGLFSRGQLVLWAAIITLGTILALAAHHTNRLGAPIVAHVLVNGFGVAAALGAFDSFLPT